MSIASEFKEFALKGNVLDLAVGVIIGAEFGKLVKAMVDDTLMPIVSIGLPAGSWEHAGFLLKSGPTPAQDVILKYGDLFGVVLNFVIIAFFLFVVIKAANHLKLASAPAKPPAPPAPPTKECPKCLSDIPLKATRCKFCTSEVE